MINLAGYETIEDIYESVNSIIYRASRKSDRQPVILKVIKREYPTVEETNRYKLEYEITRQLNLESVVKAYELINHHNSIVMVLEDFGGKSLKILNNERKLSIEEFLRLAIKVAEILGEIHAANIIHKDINPGNIVFNPRTRQLKVIDFGISTVLSRENPTFRNPNVLEGTLAYMSPEQTGRMNRAMDYRTDFYSLGATFYELLTNQIPFYTNDAMELIHCHIAKQPIPPHQINIEIPQAVSDIVIKLLAKTAEERYQSAWGIKADLEYCLTELQTNYDIKNFNIGSQDISEKFQIPQKLYGREQEVIRLLLAFDQISQGSTEMMLVSGFSGMGKSALVKEIYKPITQRRGYFLEGKFDQFQRNIPYSAIIHAFSELVRQLLTETAEKLNIWREKLLAAIGINGQILIEVIPELELIIGKQPVVQALEPVEAQNRFSRIFQNFIRVFCQPEHPLVIFLDDLQWSDLATLKLIEIIMADEEIKSLFLIGAYRDNEVSPIHPLIVTIEGLKKAGTIINNINLSHLNIESIKTLISETLHNNNELVEPLAAMVLRKTSGNPFFVNEFLKALYQENLISFDLINRRWQWTLADIEAMNITENVVELMVFKLKKLSQLTQNIVRIAACIGNAFDLNYLSIFYKNNLNEAFQHLLPAIQEGLILPLSELEITGNNTSNLSFLVLHYKFLHDRVQQAAYTLLTNEEKKEIHLKIGRSLLANTPFERRQEIIFELVDHLNIGRELLLDEQEKVELAILNLEAGKKAKDSTAYASARQYLTVGIEIITGDIWSYNYDLAFDLYKNLAEVEYLNGNLDHSEQLINIILSKAKLAIQKVEVYNLLIVLYSLNTQYEKAIQVGRKALNMLEINLPHDNLKSAIDSELIEAKSRISEKEIALLIDEPEMSDPVNKAAMKLLATLGMIAYLADQDLWALIIVKAGNFSFKYGQAPQSTYIYVCYGLILNSVWSDYQLGFQFGVLGLKLSQKFNSQVQKCQASLAMGNCLNHWVKHLKFDDVILTEGYQAGLESGDLQGAGHIIPFKLVNPFYQGVNLEILRKQSPAFLLFTKQTNNKWSTDIILGCQLVIQSLIEGSFKNLVINEEEVEEVTYLNSCQNNQNFPAIWIYKTLKAQLFYLYEQYSEAYCWIKEAEAIGDLLPFYRPFITTAEHNFYYSLILTAIYNNADQTAKAQYFTQLLTNQKQMQVWVDNCPENFLHKYLLIEAEIARISGKYLEAIELFDRAIESASENEFVQNEALGNELAAKFWLAKGKEEFAKIYMIKAHYNYQRWGAKSKVADLEHKYSQLLTKTPVTNILQDISTTITTTTRHGAGFGALDLATVMKAAQTISSEIVLSNLLEKLIKLVIENAGAQKGFLILSQSGELRIETGWAVDNQLEVLPSTVVDKTQEVPAAIINYVARTNLDVVLNDASNQGLFTTILYVTKNKPKSILCAPILNQGKLIGIVYLENNLTTGAFTPERLEVVRILASQAAISIDNALLYRTLEQKVEERTADLAQANIELGKKNAIIRKIFGRYLTNEVVANLLESPEGLKLGGERRKITILTSDIRGFTDKSERLPAEEVVKILNFYLEYMADVITKYHGTIDEFMGDGILVLFGAPTAREDDPKRAVACAVDMQLAMEVVNQKMQEWGLPQLEMGIGINTGEVVVGNIGSEKRTKYGIVGSNVNLTYRIESYTIGGQIFISESTFKEVGEIVTVGGEMQVQPKGVKKPIIIYDITGIEGKYHLFLSKKEEQFFTLPKEIVFQYTFIDGKHIGDLCFQASIVKLSEKEALVQYDCSKQELPLPLSNIKINVLESCSLIAASDNIYAKILDKSAQEGFFYIHFTAGSIKYLGDVTK